MQRIVALLIMLLMMSVVIGCGGGDNKLGSKVDGSDSPLTGGTIELGDGQEVNFGTAKQGESLPLPEKFPADVLPLLDDAVISFVNTNDANQAIGIVYATDKDFNEVVAFYKEVMEDGEINMQNSENNMYMVMGSKGSYATTISITHETGNKVNVLLDVTPQSN